MFFGSYEHSLDDKNRLILPSKIRKNVADKLYVLKGYDGCLSLYEKDEFKNYLNNLNSLPFNQKNNRDIIRIALASVYELIIDKQGRIQLPTSLISFYKIQKEVIIVGLIDHLEIWNKDEWMKYRNDNEVKFEEKAEEILNGK